MWISLSAQSRRFFQYITAGGFLIDMHGRYLIDADGRRIQG